MSVTISRSSTTDGASHRGDARAGKPWIWYATALVCSILIATAILPLFPVNWWWVRIGDFPRVQLLIAYLLALPILLMFRHRRTARTLSVGLLAGVIVQIYWIFPYLPVAAEEVQWASAENQKTRLKILTANVLQSNKNVSAVLELIAREAPDIVVLCEVNHRWMTDLAPLNRSFSFHLAQPQENKYGIALYSDLPVDSAEVRTILKDDIPSIDARVRLHSGQPVRLFAVHPNPPRPGESTAKRDAELVMVGREVKDDETVIVLGDMNDVGWSRTTNLFQEVSGLLDPRKGRGLYPTFDVTSLIWRYPLDHLFHTDNFRVVSLRRLPDIGSDHFPLLIELSWEPDAAASQTAPNLDAGDREDAEETVKAGKSEIED